MGIMSKLLTRDQPRPSAAPISPGLEEKRPEKISSLQISTPQENKNVISRSGRDPHDEKTLSEKIPCPKCSCGWFWESIYFDGVLRCVQCEPFLPQPGWEFVGRKVSQVVFTNEDGSREIHYDQKFIDGKLPGQERQEREGRRRITSALAERPTTVVHCKRDKHDIYIGRPSKWGNPFKKDGTGEDVIAKYEQWLLQQPHLMAALPELRGKVLGCWCAPNPCHGDVLARLADTSTLADGVRDGGDGESDAAAAGDGPGNSQDAHSSDPSHDLTSDDPADRFVEYMTADGRTGYALRGFNNPKAKNYDQRASMYLAIGVGAYDRRVGKIQDELRTEILKG